MALYAITARFRSGVEERRKALAGDFGSHMSQPLLHIRLVGALKDASGERIGVHMLMEAETRAQVERFLDLSPYKQAGLYESVEIDEFEIEAGGLN